MNETEKALWDRISQFSFNEDAEELTFARRLARENAWTREYTERAINEYKRFVFLAVAAGHPVTPSDQVDQVWHQHLTETRSYWDRLCGQVLNAPLHHKPTKGGPEEGIKFRLWYQRTCDSYTRMFGQQPPADIWPDVSVRFGQGLRFQRIDVGRNWIVPRPRLRTTAGMVVFVFVLLVVISGSALTIGSFLSGEDDSRSVASHDASSVLDVMAVERSNTITLEEFRSVAATVAVLIFVIHLIAFNRRCHQCKRSRAMDRTGTIEQGRWFQPSREEWRCKYCGYYEWKNEDSGCE